MGDTDGADAAPRVGGRQRLMARLALLALLAIVAIAVATGIVYSIAALVVGLIGIVVLAGAVWTFVVHRGFRRHLAAVLLIFVPIAIGVTYIAAGLFIEVLVCILLAVLAWFAAHAAAPAAHSTGPPQYAAPRTRHPHLIMNPRSGGGKVEKFHLAQKASGLGAEVELFPTTGHANVAELAAHALEDGADLLGAAGGDGTQALVAEVAARHDVPMLVVPAGTRNHFAMDLGLDRDDPSLSLDALSDGVELRIDLGMVGGRPFVNGASFGAYAEIVQSPAYRDDKTGTALRMLPDLISGHHGPRLEVKIDGEVALTAPQAVLISNNPYGSGDVAGLSRRARLDEGVLGVIGVKVESEAQAASLLTRGGQSRSITRLTSREVIIDADQPQIPVGIDGESVLLPTPVRCEIHPLALRVVVPRDRPGTLTTGEALSWTALLREALGLRRHEASSRNSGTSEKADAGADGRSHA